jgi:hypothetical protein
MIGMNMGCTPQRCLSFLLGIIIDVETNDDFLERREVLIPS